MLEKVTKHCSRAEIKPEAAREKGESKGTQAGELTFSMTDAVGWHGPPNMNDATTVGHFILIGVLACVIIIHGMHNAQIEKEFVQNLREMRSHEFTALAPYHPKPGSCSSHTLLSLAP